MSAHCALLAKEASLRGNQPLTNQYTPTMASNQMSARKITTRKPVMTRFRNNPSAENAEAAAIHTERNTPGRSFHFMLISLIENF